MVRRNNKLHIDSETRICYSKIKQNYSHLRLTNSQLFSLALAIGYQKGIKSSLNKKIAFIRHETVPTDLFSLIFLFDIDEYGEDEKWINEPLILFDLAEEYANTGIKILMQIMENQDSNLEEFLTSNILKLCDTINLEDK